MFLKVISVSKDFTPFPPSTSTSTNSVVVTQRHSDDENIYNPKAPIASLSLGGSRLMKFKKKTKKGLGKKTLKLRLNSGDLIIMKHPTQEMLKHSIPKSSTNIEERINLTFRSVIEKQDAFKTKY